MAAPGSEKSSKKKTEKKLAAREEAKLLASFMGVMNTMRKQVRGRRLPRGPAGPGVARRLRAGRGGRPGACGGGPRAAARLQALLPCKAPALLGSRAETCSPV